MKDVIVSHCRYYGVLLWSDDRKMYDCWHPFAYGCLEDAKDAAFVRDGIVVHWYWPSSVEQSLLGDSTDCEDDLPF